MPAAGGSTTSVGRPATATTLTEAVAAGLMRSDSSLRSRTPDAWAAPRVWAEYVMMNGWGVRGAYWTYDADQTLAGTFNEDDAVGVLDRVHVDGEARERGREAGLRCRASTAPRWRVRAWARVGHCRIG